MRPSIFNLPVKMALSLYYHTFPYCPIRRLNKIVLGNICSVDTIYYWQLWGGKSSLTFHIPVNLLINSVLFCINLCFEFELRYVLQRNICLHFTLIKFKYPNSETLQNSTRVFIMKVMISRLIFSRLHN